MQQQVPDSVPPNRINPTVKEVFFHSLLGCCSGGNSAKVFSPARREQPCCELKAPGLCASVDSSFVTILSIRIDQNCRNTKSWVLFGRDFLREKGEVTLKSWAADSACKRNGSPFSKTSFSHLHFVFSFYHVSSESLFFLSYTTSRQSFLFATIAVTGELILSFLFDLFIPSFRLCRLPFPLTSLFPAQSFCRPAFLVRSLRPDD